MKTLSFHLKRILFAALVCLLTQSTSALAMEKEEGAEWIKNPRDTVEELPSTDQPQLPDQSQEASLNHIFNPPSPVAKFRMLLEASSSELNSELDAFPEEIKLRIRAKIKEYQKLSTEQRHQKLLATELRWYLPPLLNIDQKTRDLHLRKLESSLADVIHQRLKTWDSLPNDLKSSSSKSSLIIGHLSQAPSQNPPLPTPSRTRTFMSAPRSSAPGPASLPSLPSPRKGGSANALNPVSQDRLQRLKEYFEMDQEAKNATLKDTSVISDSIFMSRLNWLETMPEQLRERTLSHLIRFQELSTEEKKAFGQSIQTWNRLPRSEKQALRKLVKRMPPFPGKAVQPE